MLVYLIFTIRFALVLLHTIEAHSGYRMPWSLLAGRVPGIDVSRHDFHHSSEHQLPNGATHSCLGTSKAAMARQYWFDRSLSLMWAADVFHSVLGLDHGNGPAVHEAAGQEGESTC
jgi:hypothetical protein